MRPVTSIKCPHCQTGLDIQPEWWGKSGRCPQCQRVFAIPQAIPDDSPASKDQAAESPHRQQG